MSEDAKDRIMAGLDGARRVGWAKAYKAEEEAQEYLDEINRLQVRLRQEHQLLYSFLNDFELWYLDQHWIDHGQPPPDDALLWVYNELNEIFWRGQRVPPSLDKRWW